MSEWLTDAAARSSPMLGVIGGGLIGLAAALMLLGNGRIAGVSGIAARALGLTREGVDRTNGWAFLVGLPLGAGLASLIVVPAPLTLPHWPLLSVAGVLVGFGTRLGSGCTSGHGVCGVSRLSRRSIIATGTFMLTGMLTVLISRFLGLAG